MGRDFLSLPISRSNCIIYSTLDFRVKPLAEIFLACLRGEARMSCQISECSGALRYSLKRQASPRTQAE